MERDQHIGDLKKLIHQSQQTLAEMKDVLADLENRCNESADKHGFQQKASIRPAAEERLKN